MDQVLITHPDVDAVGGPVPREAFESLWEQKGWRIVDEAASTKPATTRTARAARTEEG